MEVYQPSIQTPPCVTTLNTFYHEWRYLHASWQSHEIHLGRARLQRTNDSFLYPCPFDWRHPWPWWYTKILTTLMDWKFSTRGHAFLHIYHMEFQQWMAVVGLALLSGCTGVVCCPRNLWASSLLSRYFLFSSSLWSIRLFCNFGFRKLYILYINSSVKTRYSISSHLLHHLPWFPKGGGKLFSTLYLTKLEKSRGVTMHSQENPTWPLMGRHFWGNL